MSEARLQIPSAAFCSILNYFASTLSASEVVLTVSPVGFSRDRHTLSETAHAQKSFTVAASGLDDLLTASSKFRSCAPNEDVAKSDAVKIMSCKKRVSVKFACLWLIPFASKAKQLAKVVCMEVKSTASHASQTFCSFVRRWVCV